MSLDISSLSRRPTKTEGVEAECKDCCCKQRANHKSGFQTRPKALIIETVKDLNYINNEVAYEKTIMTTEPLVTHCLQYLNFKHSSELLIKSVVGYCTALYLKLILQIVFVCL